jgi:putative membrane protein
MKPLRSLFVVGCAVLTAGPAFAQQSPAPSGPAWAGCNAMWGEWGWHHCMMFHPFLGVLSIVALVAMVFWAARLFRMGGCHHGFHGVCSRHGQGGGYGSAMSILEERFAKGEIGKDEFEEKRKLLER